MKKKLAKALLYVLTGGLAFFVVTEKRGYGAAAGRQRF